MRQGDHPHDDVTGVVLIGGKSRRMGRDKIILPYDGKPLAAYMHDLLSNLFRQVLLIGHSRKELQALGLTCIPDLIPGKGTLGGIYTALASSRTPFVFITGADMPYLSTSLISRILDLRHTADAVVPRGPRGMEPLCAVYSASCTGTIEQSLKNDILKILPALGNLKIYSPEIETEPGEPDPFLNINTIKEWERLRQQ